MEYYLSKKVSLTFDETIKKLGEELQKEGFGILTEIDVQQTLKKKLNVDFKKYKIFGACNPPIAHQALEAEENLGVLLPCNFVVKENNENEIQVNCVNPLVTMQAVKNEALKDFATVVYEKLNKVLENIK
ncbi:MAG: DUF302 domain-containing protein [Melioribacteraceae bacterium]|nr:DUF302 domain-containing protein [Melioribacteraceae bacterium]